MLTDPRFLEIVDSAWDTPVSGDPWFVVTTKLKVVKDGLRNLNRSMVNLQAVVHEASYNLEKFQSLLPDLPSHDQLIQERILCDKL